jgi:putative PIN family toxin of toxin-antitoxin system
MAERVVFDTNVMISGLMWRGKPYHCLLLARSRITQSVYCNPMLAELTEKLRGKFKYSENSIHAVVADIRRYAERVEIASQLKIVRADPDDDKFVECAVTGQASFIIFLILVSTRISKSFPLRISFPVLRSEQNAHDGEPCSPFLC